MSTKKHALLSLALLAAFNLLLTGCNKPLQASAPQSAQNIVVPTAQPAQDTAASPQTDSQPTVVPDEPQDAKPPSIILPETQQLVAFYASNECGYTEFQVNFQVTDDVALEDVRVEYRLHPFASDPAANTLTLTATGGENGYQITVPVADIGPEALQGGAGLLEYSVVAIDKAGNETRIPEGDGWVQVVVAPCTKEVASWLRDNGISMASASNAQGGARSDSWGNGSPMVCPPNCYNNANLGGIALCITNPAAPSCASSTSAGGGMSNGTGGSSGGPSSGGTAGSSSSGGASGGSAAGSGSSGGSAGGSTAGSGSSGGSSGGSAAGGGSSGGSSGGNTAGSGSSNGSSGSTSGGGGDTATLDPCAVNPSDPSCLPTVDLSGDSGGASLANPCDVNPSDPSCTTVVGDGGNTVVEPIITPIVNP